MASQQMPIAPASAPGTTTVHMNSKSLEDMLNTDVDESAISAIVGSLENSIELAAAAAANNNNNNNSLTTSGASNGSLTNHHLNTDSSHTFSAGGINSDSTTTTTTTPNSTLNHHLSNNNNLTNHLNNNNNRTNSPIPNQQQPTEVGKRIVLSANSQPVNSSIPNSMLRMSPLTNGTMTPPPAQSPSIVVGTTSASPQTQLQHQQTIPIGQQVALVTSGQQSSSPVPTGTTIRIPTSIPLSAISSSGSVMSTPIMINSSSTARLTATKSLPTPVQQSTQQQQQQQQHVQQQPQTLLIQTNKDGQQILVSHPVSMANMRTPVSLSNSTVQFPGGGLVFTSRHGQQPQTITMTQAGMNAGQNLIQIVGMNNNTSRPTLTAVPMSGTTMAMTGGGPGASKTTLAPRVVQLPPNVRLSPHVTNLRPGTFNAPITLPSNLVGPRTVLVKTESGQIQMVTLPAQTGPLTGGPTTIRLQAAPGQTMTLPGGAGTAPNTTGPTIRTQLTPGGQIVVPVSLSAAIQQQQAKVSQAGTVGPPVAPLVHTSIPTNTQLTVQTSTANAQAASAAPSQMSPSTAKKKCKNFLSTLIRLASDQPDNVANNVKTLIQGLIDDTIQPEDFTNQLQKELNSSPQPCLVPFLKKSLPYLRYSLMKEELQIEGVRAPHSNAVTITSAGTAIGTGAHSGMGPHTLTQVGLQSFGGPRPPITQQLRLITPPGQQLGPNLLGAHGQQILTSLPPNASGNIVFSSVAGSSLSGPTILTTNSGHHFQNHQSTAPNIPQNRLSVHQASPQQIQSQQLHLQQQHQQHQQQQQQQQQQQKSHQQVSPSPLSTPVRSSLTSSASKSKSKSKAKEKADAKKAAANSLTSSGPGLFAGPAVPGVPGAPGEKSASSFRDDDDINDVAAMGGVNLQEESQRILAGNAEIIGQQIRSCKDEPFLYRSPLYGKINSILKKYELTDCPQDVVSLISHAVQERLKTLVEKLGVIAEHRQENFKSNPNYEVTQDVKAQVQFLQELDRIEKKRHEEQEREVLIRAAKSRSKIDDPDHIAIKARAKEMQRLEMEEIRQREANETALQAIGFPKKRLKTGSGASASASGSSGSSALTSTGGALSSASHATPANSTNLFAGGSKPIKRIKRVTMKDVYFMMEHEKDTVRSTTLYKTYAR